MTILLRILYVYCDRVDSVCVTVVPLHSFDYCYCSGLFIVVFLDHVVVVYDVLILETKLAVACIVVSCCHTSH